MPEETPRHKQPVDSRLKIVFPSVALLMKRKQAIRMLIKRDEEELAVMEKRSWLSDRNLRLRLPGYRSYHFARPDDASAIEALKFLCNAFLSGGPPRRRMVWRAGAGIAAHVAETSVSDEQLSAHIEMEGQDYRVTSDRIRDGERERRLHGPSSLLATIEAATSALIYSPDEYYLEPRGGVRIDLLAIAAHTVFWMEAGMAIGKPGGD